MAWSKYVNICHICHIVSSVDLILWPKPELNVLWVSTVLARIGASSVGFESACVRQDLRPQKKLKKSLGGSLKHWSMPGTSTRQSLQSPMPGPTCWMPVSAKTSEKGFQSQSSVLLGWSEDFTGSGVKFEENWEDEFTASKVIVHSVSLRGKAEKTLNTFKSKTREERNDARKRT